MPRPDDDGATRLSPMIRGLIDMRRTRDCWGGVRGGEVTKGTSAVCSSFWRHLPDGVRWARTAPSLGLGGPGAMDGAASGSGMSM